MTKQEFIKRCGNAYDMGLIDCLWLMRDWCDAMLRLEGNQAHAFFSQIEKDRSRTNDFSRTLANDHQGYKIIQLTSLLAHPCQTCAEDPGAWHTRTAFCEHKKRVHS